MGSASDAANEIREPDNSTVDDWFGQNVARDQDLADELVDEEDGDEAAPSALRPRGRGQAEVRGRSPAAVARLGHGRGRARRVAAWQSW